MRDLSLSSGASERRLLGGYIWPIALVATGLVAWMSAPGSQDLLASGGGGGDLDGDGLTNQAESVVGSNLLTPDSDFDGYTDAEEFARGSNPNFDQDTPAASEQALSLITYEENGLLYVCSVMYVQNGVPVPNFSFGLVVNGIQIPLGPGVYMGLSTYGVKDGSAPGDKVFLLRTPIPVTLIANFGSLSMYSHIQQAPGSTSSAPDLAAAATIVMAGNVPMLVQQSPQGVGGGGLGVIYRPLTPSSDLSSNWVAGKVCYHQTDLQGAFGPSLLFEVGASNCEDLDSYCDPTVCESLSGSTVEIVDPGLLAGG